jgi:hypothetical protein
MKRRNTRFSRYTFLWSTILVITVGCLMATMQSNQASETKESSVNIALKTNNELPGIPPIDKAVPAIIETASFGLG